MASQSAPPSSWRTWGFAALTGATALVTVAWGLPPAVLRPRFGVPAFVQKGEQPKVEARWAWPWSPAPIPTAVYPDLPKGRPLRVVHVADFPSLGDEARMDQFVMEMQLLAPDLILATGDISYVETQAWFDYLRRNLEATEVPVIAVAGNHERKDWPLWLRNHGELNNHRVDAGPLSVISLDSVHGRDALTPSQWRWFEAQVRDARAQGRTVIIQIHHPIFPAGTDGKGEGHGSGGNLQNFQRRFVQLCRDQGVAAVLSGHWHQDDVRDGEGRLRDDVADFPGTKFITTTTLGSEARLVTRWPHRGWGYRVLTFGADGSLQRFTSDPEGQGRPTPVWSQPLGRITVTEAGGRMQVRNGSDQALRGRFKRGGFDFPVDIPPGEVRTYPEEVR